MMENLKEIKKRIAEEWVSSVPQLSIFSENKFYRIVGCCIIGIELIRLPGVENYRPHFVVYPLWKTDLKDCLDGPTILMEIYNRKGLQFSIPYAKHSAHFSEVIECLKKQIPILLDDIINLKSIFDLVDSRFNDILVKSNSAQQAKLFELKFCISLYTGSQEHVQNVLSQIHQASNNWNMQLFETWYGKFDLWLQTLQEKAGNQEGFLKQIETNKQDKKLSRLKRSEIN